MKEATGELNLTVITVVAIAAVAAIATVFVMPTMRGLIRNKTCESIGSNYSYNPENGQCCIDDADCVDLDTAE